MTRNDLHGNSPDKFPIDLDIPEGDRLLTHARPTATQIATLKQRASDAGAPVIYVKDNFGRWRSDVNAQFAHCLSDARRGKEVVELLRPNPKDYSF